ncbi:hypothetical protein [Ferruginibacter albus]|uniref:hypothetical protein n=1 Tax=Ferruginibacter albus TaxID=2875540 RepID=UPI001CC8252C|nr:hypothetical protein [Ferruginibacter albus]UAY53041.1 hypothetical protein K9M53_05015 [Ferruginibacter albus]
MNFEQSIFPLTEFLIDNKFSITKKEQYFIKYSTNSVVITIAYVNLEHLFYIHVGQNSKSLIELTPISIKEVFEDDNFRLQSSLTIDNLISFLKGIGKCLLLGDKKIFKALNEFSESQVTKYTKQIIQSQNIKAADKAWGQKDYVAFIKCIDRTEKELLAESYLKKYRIAVNKLQK